MQQQTMGNKAMHFWHLPPNASLHGSALDSHLQLNLWIALAFFTLLHVLLFAGLLFRRRTHRPIHKATLEYLPLAAFTVLFAFLAIKAQKLWASQRYTGADSSAMQVEVTGMQFAWYFRYPGPDGTFGQTALRLVAPGEGNPVGVDPNDTYGRDDVVSSELVLPAGREVDLSLHAVDVIHGFAMPELRIKQNAVPGEITHIHFTPAVPGRYAVLCTQLCGLGHYRMQAAVRVLPDAEFHQWLRGREAQTARGTMGSAP